MAYQVIARKWRPQIFEEVTGQEPITRTLRSALEHERLHHAYLFSGARGVGKTTTARLLAKALNCHRADRPTPTPCRTTDENACPSCREIAEGRSIDVLEIDAASNTGVDNVRDNVINTIGVRPARDRYKVFIIDEVHMLSPQAFNALLKTLEEPPPRVVFIMATTEAHEVPETILSRCQHFEFRTIATTKIAERLRLIADAENIDVGDDALREIARAGEGSMRDAQSAFDQVISFSDQGHVTIEDVEMALGIASAQQLIRVMRSIVEQKPAETLAVVDDLVMRGHELRNFCRDLLAHLRDLLVLKMTRGADAEMVAPERADSLKEMAAVAGALSESDLVRFFHSLTETEKSLRESAHPRYQLEIGLVKLIEMRRLASLDGIIERLAALEESVRTGKSPIEGAGAASPPATGGSSTPRGGRKTDSNRGRATTSASPPEGNTAVEGWDDGVPPFDMVSSAPAPESHDGNGPAPASPPRSTAVNNASGPPVLKLVTLPVATLAGDGQPSFAPLVEDDAAGRSVGAVRSAASGGLVERLKTGLEERRKPFLAIALESARKVTIEGDELYVEFPPDGKHLRDNLAKPESVRLLREIGHEITGHSMGLRIVVGDAANAQAEGAKAEEDAREKQSLREMAEQHPAVQQLLRTFRGEIIDVGRVDNVPPEADNRPPK